MLVRRHRPLIAIAAVCGVMFGAAGCGDDAPEAEPAVVAPDAADGAALAPVANEDHWHASFDVYVCDGFVGPLHDTGPDIAGIHSHGDGLVHIHPWLDSAAGANATFGVFAEQVGLGIDDGSITVPEQADPEALPTGDPSATTEVPTGTTWRDGDACPDGPGRVALFVWPAGAAEDAAPTEVSPSDIAATRFAEDGQRFVLAFATEGVIPPQPPSNSELAAPSDMPTATVPSEVSGG